MSHKLYEKCKLALAICGIIGIVGMLLITNVPEALAGAVTNSATDAKQNASRVAGWRSLKQINVGYRGLITVNFTNIEGPMYVLPGHIDSTKWYDMKDAVNAAPGKYSIFVAFDDRPINPDRADLMCEYTRLYGKMVLTSSIATAIP